MNVWQYWEGDEHPYIQLCHQVTGQTNPDRKFFTPFPLPWDLSALEVQQRVDIWRAFVLKTYGGLWVDSDCLSHKSFSFVLDMLDNYDFICGQDPSSEKHVVPVNFMASRPEGVIVTEMCQEIARRIESAPIQKMIEQKIIFDQEEPHMMKRVDVPWSVFGAEVSTKAVNSHKDIVFRFHHREIFPISYYRSFEYFIERDDEDHEQYYRSDAVCYMMYNSFKKRFHRMTMEECLKGRSFLSFLFRKCLNSTT